MTNLTYNGKSFNQRPSDNYVNLGQLCSTHNKRFSDWVRTQQAKEYLTALENSLKAETLTGSGTHFRVPLVQRDVDVSGGDSGTWGHPLVAIEVARWISPKFGVWCNQHIKTLIETGKTEIKQPTHSPQPVTDHTISEYRLLMELLSEDGDDRMMHLVKNHLAYRLQAEQSKVLPGGVEITQLEGVVDVAIRLGFTVTGADERELGKYVAKRCRHLIQGKEVRFSLLTGKKVKPNMYNENQPEVETAVRGYFVNKVSQDDLQLKLKLQYPDNN